MRRHAPLAMLASLSIAVTMLVAAPAAATVEESPAPSVEALAADGQLRLAGTDRYGTAIEVAKLYDPNPPVVFVAAGTDFPDALSAAAAAALHGGPLLLTPTAALPRAVYDEIDRLQPTDIVVVGGASVVSDAVVAALETIAPTTRLSGATRYSTGLEVVRNTFASATDAIIATGRTFPDALAATGAAGAIGAPVILVDGTLPTVPHDVLDTLRELGVTHVHIAGSAGAVSNGTQSHLSSQGFHVERYGGSDRYQTAAAINDAFFPPGSTDVMFLATGMNFPDALAGAALAGAVAAPLYVTSPGCVPASVRESVMNLDASQVVVMGGTSVVSDTAAANIGCLTSSTPTISGTVTVMKTLTVNPGTWTPGTWLSYVWYADGVWVGEGPTLTLARSLLGKRITVHAHGSLYGWVPVTRVSAPTAPVANDSPISEFYPHPVVEGTPCATHHRYWSARTATGVPVLCNTTPTDSRLLWRRR